VFLHPRTLDTHASSCSCSVQLHCLYGFDVQTFDSLHYDVAELDPYMPAPTVRWGDGDGTVRIVALLFECVSFSFALRSIGSAWTSVPSSLVHSQRQSRALVIKIFCSTRMESRLLSTPSFPSSPLNSCNPANFFKIYCNENDRVCLLK
jgi:hypothetical protein